MEANPTTVKEIIELYNDKKDFFQEEDINFNDLLSLIFNVNHFNIENDSNYDFDDSEESEEEPIDDIV